MEVLVPAGLVWNNGVAVIQNEQVIKCLIHRVKMKTKPEFVILKLRFDGWVSVSINGN